MNCEKCKNKKATLFYADEGGGRHALCAACGAARSATTALVVKSAEKSEEQPPYLPDCSLNPLPAPNFPAPSLCKGDETATCPACKTTLATFLEQGEAGCPKCYAVFLSAETKEAHEEFVRMPAARRRRLEREKTLASLKNELRAAVESESFELAATLRDKIRKLTSSAS